MFYIREFFIVLVSNKNVFLLETGGIPYKPYTESIYG